MDKIEELYYELKENKGFSFDVYRNEQYKDENGYAIGIPKTEIKIPIAFLDIDVFKALFNKMIDSIDHYDSKLIGAWVFEGFVYLELSDLRDDLKLALRLGKMRKQIGIYDFAEKATIILKK